ncbi:MAG TPA: sulfotransferase [Candidatus Binataceae bacterium]|nr:sulfotransferase [Candidatus Binataceae bacterium]
MANSPLTLQGLSGRMIFGLSRLADRSSFFRKPLAPDSLIRVARRRSGLTDFGEWSFEEPLAVLLKAYENESNLSAFGWFGARWDMLRFLSNLLRLRDEEKRDPAILEEVIAQPVFVLGLPRSGTTFLHNLLSHDPDNLVPRCWQTIYPYPEHNLGSLMGDRRPRRVARQFAQFLALVPELRSLHPLDAYAPQECIEITGQVIRSLRFDTTHYVPSYASWLEAAGHHEAYRFHRRFLQHLQHQSGGARWILKTPDHIFALDALRTVYPDARFIFVHRDPLNVLPSVARLTEVLRLPFARSVDRMQIGRQVNERWIQGAKLLLEATGQIRKDHLFQIDYTTLVHEPFGVISTIYSHFGFKMTRDAEGAIQRAIAERPNGGYGQNSYRLEDYGLDPVKLRRQYDSYIDHFCLRLPESGEAYSCATPISEAV